MTALPPFDQMYRAVADRDEAYVGVFVVGVKTTGVFCRPGCPARTPQSQNVEFFVQPRDALHAGYRPCLRCRPLETLERAPQWVADLMAMVDSDPKARLPEKKLRSMGIDPDRARRYFLRNYGMTFQAYSRARRMGLALKHVREGQDVFTTGLDLGYESDSGFREAFASVLGASPSKSDGVNAVTCRWLETPLGPMLAAADSEGLCLLEFVDRRMLATQVQTLQRRFDARLVPGDSPILAQAAQELEAYFAGRLREFKVPLRLRGTPFQEEVWRRLLAIPFGQTRSYQQVAAELGNPGAVRAVGKANGDNRIAIIVPCHRVVAANGSLHGYGGGLWRKQRLLDLESGQALLV